MKKRKPVKKTDRAATKKDVAASYNRYKIYQGKQYTGMTIGRSHKWYYDKGVWNDKKITPDKWLISFATTKRRAGKAPEGSGVPVGTEYHWYIMAHQTVKKLDANSYSTSMNGLKFKLAHKRSTKESWNINEKSQRNHLIKILKNFIAELESESEIEFGFPAKPEKKEKAVKLPAKKKSLKKEKVLEEA